MKVYFLEDSNKKNVFIRMLKPIEIKGEKIILNYYMKKMSINKKIKLVASIGNILYSNNCKKIILAKSLKQDSNFINLLYGKDIQIVNSKYLFKLLIKKIIEKATKDNNIIKENTEIAFAMNYKSAEVSSQLEYFARIFKSLHIVTNNIEQFLYFSQKMYEENGIIITVTNNKKRALLRSSIIINVDFPEKMLNEYVVKDDSIIINLEEDVRIKKKRFSGKIINDFNIKLKEDSKIANILEHEQYRKFDIKDLAEIYLINNPKEIEDVVLA